MGALTLVCLLVASLSADCSVLLRLDADCFWCTLWPPLPPLPLLPPQPQLLPEFSPPLFEPLAVPFWFCQLPCWVLLLFSAELFAEPWLDWCTSPLFAPW